jgi:hypothetical protein
MLVRSHFQQALLIIPGAARVKRKRPVTRAKSIAAQNIQTISDVIIRGCLCFIVGG